MNRRAIWGIPAAMLAAGTLALAQTPDVTVVDPLAVAVGEAPLPKVGEGAPNISPEQTASYICRNQDAGLFRIVRGPALQKAHDATIRARQVRIAAFKGEAGEAAMIEAELERQKAILAITESQKYAFNAPPPRNGLRLDPVSFVRVNENGRWVLKVDGMVHNTTERTVELPAVSLRAIDVNDFSVGGQTNLLPKTELGPREDLAFSFRFHNPPAYGVRVVAMFAPPFLQRNFRGCDFFDPASFDPNRSAVRRTGARADDPPPVPAPAVGEGAPRYTPAQIAQLSRQARADAVEAYGSNGPRTLCPDAPGRRRWRDYLAFADLLDEGWIQTNTAEEARRDAAKGVFLQEDVVASELDRQKAVRAFMAARPVNPPITLAKYEQLSLERVASRPAGDDQTRITGRVQNRGKEEVAMPALRVTVADQNGLVLAQVIRNPVRKVRGEASRTFTINLAIPPELAARVQVEFAC